MRLIGNKTKLLGQIESLLLDRGVEGGTLIDIFAGSSSVGKHFKRRGYKVLANDILPSCYAQAVAAVEVSRWPAYRKFSSRYGDALSSKDFIEGMHVQGDILEHEDGQESPRRAARRLPLARAVHYLLSLIHI